MNVELLEPLELIPIGDLVSRYGVAPQSLRNWEQQGLMPPARRTPGGHRRYGPEHVVALDRMLGVAPPPRPAPIAPLIDAARRSPPATAMARL